MVTDPSQETAPETEPAVQFKKPELLDQIVTRTTLKKRDAKVAVDAALAILGEAIARGDDVVLPPLGKIRVLKTKDMGDGAQAFTLKLRTAKDASQTGKTDLATDDDDD